ncbi:MAG TPA: sialidase family protein [Candidatus Saccharimonadales bacterium]|nr:sialidase family protein [Candidatus Saccharimonadales bacterium]
MNKLIDLLRRFNLNYLMISFLLVILIVFTIFITKVHFLKQGEMQTPIVILKDSLPVTIQTTPTLSSSASVSSTSEYKIGYRIAVDKSSDTRGLGYSGQNKISVDSLGNGYIAYRKNYKSSTQVFVSKLTRLKNGKFTVSGITIPIANVSNAVQRVPSIGIDQDNKIDVLWYGLESSKTDNGRQIKFTQSVNLGKTWSSYKDISIVTGYNGQDYWQEHPSFATAPNGSIFAVWEGQDLSHENQQIKFSKSSDNGKTWTTWKNVQTTSDNTQSRPSLIYDATGNLHLFMYSSQSVKTQQIWHSVSSDEGATWSKWENISRSSNDSRHVSVVLANNKIFAVWRTQEGSVSQLYYSIYNNGSWSIPKYLAKSNENQFFPSVGINKSGNVLITWMESSDDSGLPREDPTKSSGYALVYLVDTNKFTDRVKIPQTKNIYYPHVADKNTYSDDFYITYGDGDEKNGIQIYFLALTK